MQTIISKGNSKVGNIPNISLVPVKDCTNCSACKKTCYALKAWRMYPQVRKAWKQNSIFAHKDIYNYFSEIGNYLAKKQPKYFRWHVAGDILTQQYYDLMVSAAKEFPNTKFLCFTKAHSGKLIINFSGRPKNLAIVLSMYPDMKCPRKKMPRAWMQDGTETRIPQDAIECSGHCDTCNVCWDLHSLKQDVYFHKH
jgi:hypothetical protein